MATARRVGGIRHRLVMAQAIYYAVTGVWPLIHIRSFEAISGPKSDRWLVKMVGLLAAVIGVVLGAAQVRHRLTPEIRLLGIGSALSFAAIDVNYSVRRRISAVYLIDSVINTGFAIAWLSDRTAGPRARDGSRSHEPDPA